MARRMWHVCFAMSSPFEWRINHVFPLNITEVIDHNVARLHPFSLPPPVTRT